MDSKVLDLLMCPACGGKMDTSNELMSCVSCEARYRASKTGKQWDLRLATLKTHRIDYRLGENPTEPLNVSEKLPFNPKRENRKTYKLDGDLTYGNRLTPELISYFPLAKNGEEWMLDLGCGHRNFQAICQDQTGFNYVGVDYTGDGPDLLADAHALPFKDQSFEFILSIAVLEHLAYPDVAMDEAFRVLKPGGTFIGTVAFLEPFHMNSFYHMSHLGVARALTQAGFHIEALVPNSEWSGTRAQAEMTLFPGLPRSFKRNMTSAVTPISKALWALRHAIQRKDDVGSFRRLLETTGGYRFVVTRPTSDHQSRLGPVSV